MRRWHLFNPVRTARLMHMSTMFNSFWSDFIVMPSSVQQCFSSSNHIYAITILGSLFIYHNPGHIKNLIAANIMILKCINIFFHNYNTLYGSVSPDVCHHSGNAVYLFINYIAKLVSSDNILKKDVGLEIKRWWE